MLACLGKLCNPAFLDYTLTLQAKRYEKVSI